MIFQASVYTEVVNQTEGNGQSYVRIENVVDGERQVFEASESGEYKLEMKITEDEGQVANDQVKGGQQKETQGEKKTGVSQTISVWQRIINRVRQFFSDFLSRLI